jgi:hypothetical protein
MEDSPAGKMYNDASWEQITIPHTWNATDAQDGGNNYLRTIGWYRKILAWQDNFIGKKIYIEFLGANSKAECFINGISVGMHRGGYTAFRFDITDQLTTGDNVIAVKVDNRHDEAIAPHSGDFSFFGGIYRKVSLVVTDPLHIDLMDNGASGLYLSTKNVSEASAGLEIKSKIVNDALTAQEVSIQAVLRNPDTFAGIAGITNPAFTVENMHPGGTIETVSETLTINPGEFYEFKKDIVLTHPHLWNGKTDPYRYLVDLTISRSGQVIDHVSQYIGFRYFEAKTNGFFLNGKEYLLRGVNRHQDRKNMGNAITEKEHEEDFSIIYEMGTNAIRLAHYPQDPYIYDLCDRYGIIVWAEIPMVNSVAYVGNVLNEDFKAVTKSQLRELIRQQYNRPSICFWGLQNEVSNDATILMTELNDLAHTEDSSRLTTQAVHNHEAWDSDLIAWNKYPGWYEGGRLSYHLSGTGSNNRPKGVSEYGAGGSIYQHEINPNQPSHNGTWHPEEYQNKVHEEAIIDISKSKAWCTFLWNMFDFASDYRAEGDQYGINDKGIVTYDRKVKKDSYYAYKVNWSTEPTVYIASRRYTDRQESITPVTVYSNCESVELFVNEVSQGIIQREDTECGFFKWSDIALEAGHVNDIKAKGRIGTAEYTDEVQWTKGLEPVVENCAPVISTGKTVYSSGEEGATDVGGSALNEYLNDGKLDTRWAAPKRNGVAGYPEWVEIDLGDIYNICEIELYFYKYGENNRAYQYEILFNENAREEENYLQKTDFLNNKDRSGHYIHSYMEEKTRYVKVNIEGVDPESQWSQASIYEITIKGSPVILTSLKETGHNTGLFTITNENNRISVKVKEPYLSIQLDIINILGNKVISEKINRNKSFFLEKGIYLIKGREGSEQETVKYIMK